MDNYIITYGLNGYFKLSNVAITSETYVKYKLVPLEAPAGFWFGTFAGPLFGIYHPDSNFPNNTFRWYMGYSEDIAYRAASVNDIINNTFEMEMGYGNLTINGTQTQQPTFAVPFTVSNFGIGSAIDGTFDFQKPVKWYYFQIYNGDTLVYDLVPAYYNNTYCFYDNISQTYILPIGNVDGYVETFSATPSKDNFVSIGETITITVVSDNPWSATAPGWVSLSSYSGQEGGIITATAGENNTGSDRSGSLTFTDGSNTVSFVLSQGSLKTVILKNLYRNSKKVPLMFRNGVLIYRMLQKLVFEVDTDSISFEAGGGTYTIAITANDNWIMTVPEWLTASQISGTSNATITLTAPATETDKTGDIVITCGGEEHTIQVEQSVYKYFRITNRTDTDGTITLRKYGSPANLIFKLRVNGGEWSSPITYSAQSTITIPANGYVEFDGSANAYFNNQNSNWWALSYPTVDIDVSGDLMSLVSGDSITTDYEFRTLFNECSKLVNASGLTLPSNTRSYCYRSMFNLCSSLVSAPELPAATLTGTGPYYQLFNGCSKLNYVKCLATSGISTSSLQNWLNGVSSTGTFVKKRGVTYSSGASGIPANWTVEEID